MDLKRRLARALRPTPARGGKKQPSDGELAAVATDWRQLLAEDGAMWQEARNRARGGPKVLIATSVGGHAGATPVESLLAVALTLRGADVHLLLCDRFLPACMLASLRKESQHATFVQSGPAGYLCERCCNAGDAVYRPLGLPIHWYSELVSTEQRQQAASLAGSIPLAEIAAFRANGIDPDGGHNDGLAVGEHAQAGALRYFARGDLEGEPDGETVLRRYFHASLLTTWAAQTLFSTNDFDVACFHHGIYVPQGLIGEVARAREVRVVNWNVAYRKQCFIFSHGDTYHHTLMNEPVSMWEDIVWSPQLESQVMDYLYSRWEGARDWVWFHENPQHDYKQIAAELGLDASKPIIGLLTNVMWDAQLHYPANAFPNMLAWVLETIAWFAGRPELQLVIRVHPAEIRGTIPSRQKIVDEIAQHLSAKGTELPANVFVIPPESSVSTYAVTLQCDSVIIYGTKTGVELSSFGVPVIVAGEAWIRNKGVTMDARTSVEYYQLLDGLPLGRRLDLPTLQRARKYAYHFFFRRMIPLTMFQPVEGWPPYQLALNGLETLLPDQNQGLDVVCQGILEGTPFVYPAERVGEAGRSGNAVEYDRERRRSSTTGGVGERESGEASG